jgi:hypothetical protein
VVILGSDCECRSRCEVRGSLVIDFGVLIASCRAIRFILFEHRKKYNRPTFLRADALI